MIEKGIGGQGRKSLTICSTKDFHNKISNIVHMHILQYHYVVEDPAGLTEVAFGQNQIWSGGTLSIS